MAGARALDIPLRQCLVNYVDDENGFFWHQRILVSRGPNLQWIWITPTRSVQLGDLTDLNILPLQRNKPLPRHLLGQIFGFDPLTVEQLRDLMGQAKELAEIYGFDRDSRGARFLDFRSMLLRSKQIDQVGLPLKGPYVAPEMAVALRDAGREGFETHHSLWAAKSGVPERSAAVRGHRLWSQVLRMGISFDLLDPANCASLEFAARRLAQIETAVKRNPKVPDYDGLDAMLETTIDSTGAAVALAVGSRFAELRKTQAVVMKADRQLREEQTTLPNDKYKKNDS